MTHFAYHATSARTHCQLHAPSSTSWMSNGSCSLVRSIFFMLRKFLKRDCANFTFIMPVADRLPCALARLAWNLGYGQRTAGRCLWGLTASWRVSEVKRTQYTKIEWNISEGYEINLESLGFIYIRKHKHTRSWNLWVNSSSQLVEWGRRGMKALQMYITLNRGTFTRHGTYWSLIIVTWHLKAERY